MATRRKKEPESGMVGRLAERGEDAVTRLIDELGRSPRVTDALGRALAAKGKLDSGARTALGSVGLAAADEIKDLRTQLERLERRLAKLEGSAGTTATAKKSESKKTPTARKRTTKSSSAKKTASPAPGRSIGGGTGRGSSPGGGAAA